MPRRKRAADDTEAEQSKRSRPRANTEEAGPSDEPAAELRQTAQPVASGLPPERREAALEVARRRAAHFAHYGAEESDEEAGDAAHTGGSEARGLGPWSSAMQLVEARAEALAAREAKRLEQSAQQAETLRQAVSWQPSRDPKAGRRPEQRVPPLVTMCVQLMVEYIEDVESLVGLPDVIKVQLAAEVCRMRKLTPDVAKLFVEGAPSEVVLSNCTQLEEPHMQGLLRECSTPMLERLDLDCCGRGMGPPAAAALAHPSTSSHHPAPSLSALESLMLGGAYRLEDAGLQKILEAAPNLTHLRLVGCSRLQGPILQAMPRLLPKLRVLDLGDCRGIGAEALRTALAMPPAMSSLESLGLAGLAELDDQLLGDVLLTIPGLLHLNVSHCSTISDAGLRGIAAACPGLQSLRAQDVGKITDKGLVALSEGCPRLQELSLRKSYKVTDSGVAALAAQRSLVKLVLNCVPALTDATVKALVASCSEVLEELDLSWCRGVSGPAVGLLADSCPNLRKLRLFGCSQVDKEILEGHSNDVLIISGAPMLAMQFPHLAQIRLIEAEA